VSRYTPPVKLPQTFAPDLTSVKRHYSAGTRWQYCYTYAEPTEVGPRAPLQLEFWIPKGRKGGSWVTAKDSPLSERPNSRTWRRVRPGHSYPDKLAHSIASVKAGYARAVETQIKDYLAWAHVRGLTRVHAFTGCKVARKWAPGFALEVVTVDPADFIGPAPAAETDAEQEAA
jgi:hypothetical protein